MRQHAQRGRAPARTWMRRYATVGSVGSVGASRRRAASESGIWTGPVESRETSAAATLVMPCKQCRTEQRRERGMLRLVPEFNSLYNSSWLVRVLMVTTNAVRQD